MPLIMQIDHPREIWGARDAGLQFLESPLPRNFTHAKGQCSHFMDLPIAMVQGAKSLQKDSFISSCFKILRKQVVLFMYFRVSIAPDPTSTLSHFWLPDTLSVLQSVLRDIQRQSRTSIASSGLLEYKDERSWTPLLAACAQGNYKCAELVSIPAGFVQI